MSGTYVGSRLASTAARTKQSQPHQNTKPFRCRGGACPARCTNPTIATPSKYKSTLYPCRGRPMCRPAANVPLSCTGAHTGAPLQGRQGFAHRSQKRAGRPYADRRSDLQPQTPSHTSAKRFGCGHCPPGVHGLSPCRSQKQAGAPLRGERCTGTFAHRRCGPRRSDMQFDTPLRKPAKRSGIDRSAVKCRGGWRRRRRGGAACPDRQCRRCRGRCTPGRP